MGYVRVWWPPVVLGLVIALLGISLVEVAGLPAKGVRVAAGDPTRPQRGAASVAPAAIERYDDVEPEPEPDPGPRTRPPRTRPSAATRARPTVQPTRAPRPSPKPTSVVKPKPTSVVKPKVRRGPTPAPTHVPTPTPALTPVLAPAPSPSPPPRPVPLAKPTAPPPVRPAQVLNLGRWKLTLPAGRKHHPIEIRQPGLTIAGNGSYFRLRPDRGVMFRAPVGGVTTENSSYPRAELREMTVDGSREAGWSSASGRHVMTITQAITGVPRAKPHVVAGQIHDAEDDVVMIRLEGRRLFVESGGDAVGVLDPSYRLGRRFTVSVVATSSGIQVTYRGSGVARSVHVRKVGHGWYFKAGCYVQSNPDRGDRPSAYGEVVIYALTVRHSRL